MSLAYYTNIDLKQNQLMNFVIQNLASDPTGAKKGQAYFNTVTNRLRCYNGTTWDYGNMTGDEIVAAINGSTAIIDDNNLSEAVNDAIAKTHNTHAISDVTGLQEALNGKVDDDQVLTNVPVGAVFTDTVTTINGKTGAITKDDIVALGIPAQDTNTVYTHPTGDGNLHVPATGTTNNGKILMAGATAGSLNWTTPTISSVNGLQAALDAKETPSEAQAKATTALNDAKSYTDTAISNLVATAPGTLDTLNELASALGNDPNFATTITNLIAERAKKVVASIGDGVATTFVVTHNLNTQDADVSLRETAAPYAKVYTDVEFTSANTLTVKFAAAPTASQFSITIVG